MIPGLLLPGSWSSSCLKRVRLQDGVLRPRCPARAGTLDPTPPHHHQGRGGSTGARAGPGPGSISVPVKHSLGQQPHSDTFPRNTPVGHSSEAGCEAGQGAQASWDFFGTLSLSASSPRTRPGGTPSGSQMHPGVGTPGGAGAPGKDVPGIFPRSAATGPRAPFQTPILGLGGSSASVAFIPSAQQLWSGGVGDGPAPTPLNPTYPTPLWASGQGFRALPG